jgi:hypothetical protein
MVLWSGGCGHPLNTIQWLKPYVIKRSDVYGHEPFVMQKMRTADMQIITVSSGGIKRC